MELRRQEDNTGTRTAADVSQPPLKLRCAAAPGRGEQREGSKPIHVRYTWRDGEKREVARIL